MKRINQNIREISEQTVAKLSPRSYQSSLGYLNTQSGIFEYIIYILELNNSLPQELSLRPQELNQASQ